MVFTEKLFTTISMGLLKIKIHKILYEKFMRGINYHNQGNRGKAIESYDEAIELQPDYVEDYNNRGLVFREIGKFN